jgi:hypothetical protein
MHPNLLRLVPLLRTLIQQPQYEVLRRAGDILPLTVGEFDTALLDLVEKRGFVVCLERRLSA